MKKITKKGKINKKIIKEFHKRFANGEQYLTITKMGDIVEADKFFYWQQREVYNHILPIVEMMKAKYDKVFSQNEDLLYGENGLVSMLVPIQRAYNAVCNKKSEFINRISNGILVVEDGSVDIDALEEEGMNPNGKVLIYRNGATPPTLMKENVETFDFFEKERNALLCEFDSIANAFCMKCENLNKGK